MGLPTTPQDAAPAYDDVFHDHPANLSRPSASTSAYSTVPQDDVELQAHTHDHMSASPPPTQQPESLAQTIAGVFRPKPHIHCEQCDVQTAARERRENERHCCTMVAVTFMTSFFCLMVLGIAVANAMARAKRRGQMHG